MASALRLFLLRSLLTLPLCQKPVQIPGNIKVAENDNNHHQREHSKQNQHNPDRNASREKGLDNLIQCDDAEQHQVVEADYTRNLCKED